MSKAKKFIELVAPYCKSIRKGNRHYICRLHSGDTVVISSTPSDGNAYKQVFRDFRRHGIIIKHLTQVK